jgi:membrane protein implicated in regulation of membrane protease activity
MGKKVLYWILSWMSLSILLLVATPVSAPMDPPDSGEWTIDGPVTHRDKIIMLNGDLIIEDGGVLTLQNVDLQMNCKSDREFTIRIRDGGVLNLYDSKISSRNYHLYAIVVETEGELNIYNSTITDFCTFQLYKEEYESGGVLYLSIMIMIIIIVILLVVMLMLRTKRREIAQKASETKSVVGYEGLVIKNIQPYDNLGKVKVSGQIWNATAEKKIEKGSTIKVIESEGLNLKVEEVE